MVWAETKADGEPGMPRARFYVYLAANLFVVLSWRKDYEITGPIHWLGNFSKPPINRLLGKIFKSLLVHVVVNRFVYYFSR
jgi:hypothetical protein